jgi:hypothetical protein
LFAGLSHADESLSKIEKTIAEVKAAYGSFIRCHVVITKPEQAAAIKSADSILLDNEGATLSHKYGAAQGCLYLIRPDGYIGFRSQPVDFQYLQEFLERVVGVKATAVK